MKERPIRFNAPMVRAILEGRKTSDRRVISVQSRFRLGLNDIGQPGPEYLNEWGNWQPWVVNAKTARCPYGQPGDRLWVRETFMHLTTGNAYRADDLLRDGHPIVKWRPSIHMPRWASRITLDITKVQVERLQDISEDDAKAEGLSAITKDGKTVKYGIPDADGFPGTDNTGWPWSEWCIDPRKAYKALWESINGPGSWEANPWVWVIEFKAVKP